jgi:hypothetical protein
MYEGTPRSSTLTRVSRTIEALARALFARSDRNAGTRGWDVTVTGRWRTSRVYHDPRYDRLATCTGCAGRGCSRCAGTGRITAAGGGAEQRPPRYDHRLYQHVAAESSSDQLEPIWPEPRRRLARTRTTPAGSDRWDGVVVPADRRPVVVPADRRPVVVPADRRAGRQRRNQDAGGIGWDRSRR